MTASVRSIPIPSLITRARLKERFPVPRTAQGLRVWVLHRGFPAPRYANNNLPLWNPDEVEAWFQIASFDRISARLAKAGVS